MSWGEPEYMDDGYGEGSGGTELDVVRSYFPESSPAPAEESYADDVPVERQHESPEAALVREYRESSFDPAEVQEWRQAVEGVVAGDYTADEYLQAYEDDGEADEYAEIEGLGEPEPSLTPDEALDALKSLPPEQMAQGIQYLEANHPGAAQALLETYVDRQQRDKLTESWMHLESLNQALADRQDRQEQEQDAQLAQAETEARSMVAEEFHRAGAGRIDPDTGLDAANKVADMQIAAWQQAGYSQEEIDAALTPEFAAWAIKTAAELGRQASITHYALGKV
jgi:hypothetical protein